MQNREILKAINEKYEDKVNYEVMEYWKLNEDNQKDFENRCVQSGLPIHIETYMYFLNYFCRAILIGILTNHAEWCIIHIEINNHSENAFAECYNKVLKGYRNVNQEDRI